MRCCISGCTNKKDKNKSNSVTFYYFPKNNKHMPWLCDKRIKWINAVKKHTKHPNHWLPSTNTTICSAHFIGNKRSENPLDPSYIPTIFPGKENDPEPQELDEELQIFERLQCQIQQAIPRLKPTSVPSRFPWNHKNEERKPTKRICAGRPHQMKYIEEPPKARDPLYIDQCRFCAQFSKDCIVVSDNMPYLANNQTTLIFNGTRLQIDFNYDYLPKTVCRDCDAKLQDFVNFTQAVQAAQETLISTVAVQTVVKTEHDSDVELIESPVNNAVKTRGATKKSVKIDLAKGRTKTPKKECIIIETAEDKKANVDILPLVEIRFANKDLGPPRFLKRVSMPPTAIVRASTGSLKNAMCIAPKRKIGEIITKNQKKIRVEGEGCEFVETEIEKKPIVDRDKESDLEHSELNSDLCF